MDATRLVVKLIAVEQSLGKRTFDDTRGLIIEAQDYALELERQLLDVLNENERLRQSIEKLEQQAPARLIELRLPLRASLPPQVQTLPAPTKSPILRAGRLVVDWRTRWQVWIGRARESDAPCFELNRALDRIALNSLVKAGTLLFRGGESASAIFLVRRGSIALEWTSEYGMTLLEPLGPGKLVGLPAAFNGTYSVTARAADDSELGYIPVDWVIQLLARDPDLCISASRIVAQEIAGVRSLIINSLSHVPSL